MLWIKALHVIFMVTWFAGLFYLPRLFVYHSQAVEPESIRLFETMERKLFAIMTIGAALTIAFGLWLLAAWWLEALQSAGWLHVKLALVAGLLGYHLYCWHLIKVFAAGENSRSHIWYRWFNEVPALLLIAIVLLAYIKPF